MKVTTDACLFGAWVAKKLHDLDYKTALDIGTGTGLLSLMIAQKNNIEMDAVEIDHLAAEEAKENIEGSTFHKNVQLIEGDILEFIPANKYDVILSNPPFYENDLMAETQARNKAFHSSHLTLTQLLQTIKKVLAADGRFFLLLPFRRKDEAIEIIKENGFEINEVVHVHHSPIHPPTRIMLMCGYKKEFNASDIYIRENDSTYSKAFTELLKDYYLYL